LKISARGFCVGWPPVTGIVTLEDSPLFPSVACMGNEDVRPTIVETLDLSTCVPVVRKN
jgi:hypothetical protein